ncbi:hypothetical protein J3B02_004114, partial [Coemansia erecta]
MHHAEKSMFIPLSIRSALRLRQRLPTLSFDISTIHLLSDLASSAERAYHVSEAGDGGRQLPLACQYNPAGDRIVLVDEAG